MQASQWGRQAWKLGQILLPTCHLIAPPYTAPCPQSTALHVDGNIFWKLAPICTRCLARQLVPVTRTPHYLFWEVVLQSRRKGRVSVGLIAPVSTSADERLLHSKPLTTESSSFYGHFYEWKKRFRKGCSTHRFNLPVITKNWCLRCNWSVWS